MRFRVLGPVRVWHAGEWVTIRAAQPRVVLAILLIEAGRVVSADRLVDELWGDHPPRTALNTVQGYIARLRKLLGDGSQTRLLTRGRGYVLEVADGELDSWVFDRLVEAGQRELAGGRLSAGVEQLVEALALWQGAAMHDVLASPMVAAEANRLEQRRLTALEARLGAELALGRHVETVDELARLVEEYPLREKLRCHLMLAMYRCGRRAEALDVYRNGRAVLVAELGMEPGPELSELERAILADDRTLAGGGVAVRVTPAQVPAGVAGFTGRHGFLRQLDGLPPAVGIVVVAGTPGVGKTALAVHWAHRVRDRFSDGQLYVNLRGYASGPPVEPIDALARFLHALGVAAEQVPTDVDEAAALYRSLLADRRMLVLLDNAHHPDQVRPLLPGAPGCMVVVTSRDALTGLIARDGARGLRLDVLTVGEAKTLLAYLLGEQRVHAEALAVSELAELCAYLPLALRITAANLGAHTVTEYCELLRAGNRLANLEVEGDEQTAVRAAFDLSYAVLPEDARRLFRLLGLVPGADVTVDAAAALAGITTDAAALLLSRLHAAHLVDQHAADRYGCHDLLRLYASERGELEDLPAARQNAVNRLYDWYLYTVDAAATLLYPQMRRLTLPPVDTEQLSGTFADNTQALAWLDAERHNLVAAIRHQSLPVIGLLADALRGYFWLRIYIVDWLTVASAGLAAAEACDDLTGQTGALLSLADVNFRQGQYQQAIDFSARALTTAKRAGWAEGEAAALNNLGNLHNMSGRLRDAVGFYQIALALNQRLQRLPNQVNNLTNLGIAAHRLGDLRTALARYTDALEISRKIGSSHAEAVNLSNFGVALRDLGQYDEALDHLRNARAKHQEVGDRGSEVETGNELAALFRDTGEYSAALEHAQAALTIARDVVYRHGEVDVLNTLGSIHLRLGHQAIAVDHHRQALALARDTAHRYGETSALIGLAVTQRDAAPAQEAIELANTVGYRVLEGQARVALARIRLAEGVADTDLAEQALACHRETGYRLGEAEALRVLGAIADHAGNADLARALRRDAGALLSAIGAADPDTAFSSGLGVPSASTASVSRHGE
ncbi:DNA-binding SARP family transcriptional activator/Tfp pilus assembly protein PilF [Kibdelosporangium banguiense]|uniref:DNA-binding SARP family transcriptional activator/Tfp pilus assembly protein PilF n=1 Tax=Kibdelosporangium banguiense TaxID=1365924 RepID=A0ABS4T5V1_9PSEU|nr:BTAD domain-containing putative transcriptional regulator [Kibdelosporangium banguiense]MBP2319844.1 DNA-binding SARP family transcriptional activator/Tfp pilus assembly protein PilF [Kibdelosporangium banguiense]